MPEEAVQSPRIAIVAAMEKETRPFLAELEGTEETTLLGPSYGGPARFFTGTLGGLPVLLAESGIGTTNAAVATTGVITGFVPHLIVVAGTAGGLEMGIGAGDLVVAESALYHEADATEFGYLPGQIPRMPPAYCSSPVLRAQAKEALDATGLPFLEGTVGSSNSFVTAANAEDVRERFPGLLSVDMETAAIAQTCELFGVPWISLRAVSDLCEPDGAGKFRAHAPEAAATSKQAVSAFLDVLENNPSSRQDPA